MELLERLEISILNLREVLDDNDTQRIDSEYFKKKHLLKIKELKSNVFKPLFDLGLIKGGKRLPLGEDFSENGIPYIRAQDVKNNFINFENSPKISEKLHLQLINYQISKNDVLITNVGNSIGDTGIVKFELEKCNLTENAVRIISKKVKSEYLFIFFQSKYGRFQIERETVGTAQPKLAIERIRKFVIPIIDNLLQSKIAELIDNSYSLKSNSKQTYAKAETNLLQEIGLDEPTISHLPSKQPVEDSNPSAFTNNNVEKEGYSSPNINVKSFATSFGTTGRLDAEYYQKKYEVVIEKIKSQNYNTLQNIVTITKSLEPGSDYYSDDETGLPFMRVADYNKFGLSEPNKKLTFDFIKENQDKIDALKPKKGSILFSKDGSVGTAYHLREDFEGITSSAILNLKVRNEKEVIPEYLTLALNSKLVQMQAERDAGGSIILHWRIGEIQNVVVPIINFNKQQEIAKLIEESFSLKKQSEHLLKVAKRAVEIAIEENEEVAMLYINENVKSLKLCLK